MSWDKVLGPATIVYIVSATVAALWWASDLTTRVKGLEASTVTAERMVRLESETRQVGETTRELKTAVNDLVRELRRNP